MGRIIRGRYGNVKRSRYRTAPYKWDFRNRSWDVGRRPVKGPDRMTLLNAGASATFVNDAASANGWTFDTTDDTLWIGAVGTGIRIVDNGGTSAGFKIQTVEYDPGVLLKFTGSACTRVRCRNSPTDITGELDVSALTSLTYLHCSDNSISVLDVSALTSLTILYCYDNSISVLDVSALTSLTTLYCYDNSISVLDVSALTSLTTLYCHNNSISVLDVSALTSLTYLYMYSTSITSVAAGAFDNIDVLVKLEWYNCALSTAVVDLCVTDFHTDRAAKSSMATLKLAGTNEPVTGAYQAPAVPGSPANAAEAAHELVNVEGWTVEVNVT